MPNKKISAMDAATTLLSVTVPVIQGSSNKRAPIALFFLAGTATLNFASVANGAISATLNVTVAGAVVGDWVVDCAAEGDIATTDGVELVGKVTAANTVEVFLRNNSGGVFDAANQDVNVLVVPKGSFGL
jgi:hypothetical protein